MPHKAEPSQSADLLERLTAYRARLEGEGRREGVKTIDRAIEQLRQTSNTV